MESRAHTSQGTRIDCRTDRPIAGFLPTAQAHQRRRWPYDLHSYVDVAPLLALRST